MYSDELTRDPHKDKVGYYKDSILKSIDKLDEDSKNRFKGQINEIKSLLNTINDNEKYSHYNFLLISANLLSIKSELAPKKPTSQKTSLFGWLPNLLQSEKQKTQPDFDNNLWSIDDSLSYCKSATFKFIDRPMIKYFFNTLQPDVKEKMETWWGLMNPEYDKPIDEGLLKWLNTKQGAEVNPDTEGNKKIAEAINRVTEATNALLSAAKNLPQKH